MGWLLIPAQRLTFYLAKSLTCWLKNGRGRELDQWVPALRSLVILWHHRGNHWDSQVIFNTSKLEGKQNFITQLPHLSKCQVSLIFPGIALVIHADEKLWRTRVCGWTQRSLFKKCSFFRRRKFLEAPSLAKKDNRRVWGGMKRLGITDLVDL